jgi:anti-sigma regulatory factor (Ser/Thr protein kinase)
MAAPVGSPLARQKDQTSPTVEGIGLQPLLSEAFDHSRVPALRHVVASAAASAGLAGQRLDDFVMAVNELLTNAVRHGGGTGHVALWRSGAAVVCEVSDRGDGLERPDPAVRPAPEVPGGWGLWLAGELTDELEIKSSQQGTAVRITSRVF